jgi:hypothetical protein
MSRVFVIVLAVSWTTSLAWLFGMWVAERRHVRRRDALAAQREAEHQRIAAMFGEWEREHIEWRRQRSEQIHPSQRGDTDRQGNDAQGGTQ